VRAVEGDRIVADRRCHQRRGASESPTGHCLRPGDTHSQAGHHGVRRRRADPALDSPSRVHTHASRQSKTVVEPRGWVGRSSCVFLGGVTQPLVKPCSRSFRSWRRGRSGGVSPAESLASAGSRRRRDRSRRSAGHVPAPECRAVRLLMAGGVVGELPSAWVGSWSEVAAGEVCQVVLLAVGLGERSEVVGAVGDELGSVSPDRWRGECGWRSPPRPSGRGPQ
jgi:hypothetical protein